MKATHWVFVFVQIWRVDSCTMEGLHTNHLDHLKLSLFVRIPLTGT